jgi:hypothetical protein
MLLKNVLLKTLIVAAFIASAGTAGSLYAQEQPGDIFDIILGPRDDGGYTGNRGGYDQNGYDQYGYDRYGYDRYGYDRNGYDRNGYDRNGYDRNGYDRYGNRYGNNTGYNTGYQNGCNGCACERNGYYGSGSQYEERHDNGKHKGWYKNGKKSKKHKH